MVGDRNPESYPKSASLPKQERTNIFIGSDGITLNSRVQTLGNELPKEDVARNLSDFSTPGQKTQRHTDATALQLRYSENMRTDDLKQSVQDIINELKTHNSILTDFRKLSKDLGNVEVQAGESETQFKARLEQFKARLTDLDNRVGEQLGDSSSSHPIASFTQARRSKLDQIKKQVEDAYTSSNSLEPTRKQQAPKDATLRYLCNTADTILRNINSSGISSLDGLRKEIGVLRKGIDRTDYHSTLHTLQEISVYLQNTFQEASNSTRSRDENCYQIYSKALRAVESEKNLRKAKKPEKRELLDPSEIQFLQQRVQQNLSFYRGLLGNLNEESERLNAYKSQSEAVPASYARNALHRRNKLQIAKAETSIHEDKSRLGRMIGWHRTLMRDLDKLLETHQEQLQPQKQLQPQEWKALFSNSENSKRVTDIKTRLTERYNQATQEGDQEILQQLAIAKNVLMNKAYGISALEMLQGEMQAKGKSLSEILSEREKEQGFNTCIPVDSFLKPHLFKRNLRDKRPMFDPGAGTIHGPYTHRLQFSAILRQARLDGILEMEPADLYASMGKLRFTTGYNKLGAWDDVADINVDKIRAEAGFSVIEISEEVSDWKMHHMHGFSNPDFFSEYLNFTLSPGPLRQELQLAFLKHTHFGPKSLLGETEYAQSIRDMIVFRFVGQEEQKQDLGQPTVLMQKTSEVLAKELRDKLDQEKSTEALEQHYAALKCVVPTSTDLDGDFFRARDRIIAENASPAND